MAIYGFVWYELK